MDYSTSTVSTEEIGRVAMHDDVKRRALSVVEKKLGHIFGTDKTSEVHQIAEDALNEVTMGLLNATHAGTTSLKAEETGVKPGSLANPVTRYLLAGVSNYCDIRLRRWSVKNEKGEVGRRARHIIRSELADDADYWDQHISHTESFGSLDNDRVDALLSAKGLSGEDIDLIKRNLGGWSFVELAAEYGGTADKYRRRFQRALYKAGIDSSLLG
ncbi:hypothetical protein QQF73_00490 [Marinobacter sp. M216]|uniref:Uncharacterized protein n=1 Tax=Marinobacter albus TaxID=3030833 RepID=A0ABT7H6U2_9GAMM|nr:hypothetical protein [Marinobacter sp. M216]MDK9556081.1 hypothetical protein [Marinobacter sp. M216]